MPPGSNGEYSYGKVEVKVDVVVPGSKVDVDPKGYGKLGREVDPTKLDGLHQGSSSLSIRCRPGV